MNWFTNPGILTLYKNRYSWVGKGRHHWPLFTPLRCCWYYISKKKPCKQVQMKNEFDDFEWNGNVMRCPVPTRTQTAHWHNNIHMISGLLLDPILSITQITGALSGILNIVKFTHYTGDDHIVGIWQLPGRGALLNMDTDPIWIYTHIGRWYHSLQGAYTGLVPTHINNKVDILDKPSLMCEYESSKWKNVVSFDHADV